MAKKKVFFVLAIVAVLIGSVAIESNVIQKLLYPRKYSEYVKKYANEFNIDENLVYSVIRAESKFRKNAVSHKGAKGLMQISDITRDWAVDELELGTIDVFNPETNIKIGCWYLNTLFKEFGNINLVIAAYNGGSGNVKKWLNDSRYSRDGSILNDIPFVETSNYLRKVTKNYEKYNEIYDKEGMNE